MTSCFLSNHNYLHRIFMAFVESVNLIHLSMGIDFHTSFIGKNSFKFFGFRCCIYYSTSIHNILMGFRSGDCAGHFKQLMFWSDKNVLTRRTMCFRSYLLDKSNHFPDIFLYMVAISLLLYLNKHNDYHDSLYSMNRVYIIHYIPNKYRSTTTFHRWFCIIFWVLLYTCLT